MWTQYSSTFCRPKNLIGLEPSPDVKISEQPLLAPSPFEGLIHPPFGAHNPHSPLKTMEQKRTNYSLTITLTLMES